MQNNSSIQDSVFVTLSNNSKTVIISVKQSLREDINRAYNIRNSVNAGFKSSFFTEGLDKGDYEFGVAIKAASGEWFYHKFGKLSDFDRDGGKPKKLESLPKPDNKQIGWIESADIQRGKVIINGWAAFNDTDSYSVKNEIVFAGVKQVYTIEAKIVMRPDVTDFHKSKYNYDASGFNVILDQKKLPPGDYTIGIITEDLKNGRKAYKSFDRKITVK